MFFFLLVKKKKKNVSQYPQENSRKISKVLFPPPTAEMSITANEAAIIKESNPRDGLLTSKTVTLCAHYTD